MPESPRFETMREGFDSPCSNAESVTPSDSVDLTYHTRGLYIGVAGDVSVEMIGEEGTTTVTFVGLLAGSILPVRVSRVNSTSTTATSIVAIW